VTLQWSVCEVPGLLLSSPLMAADTRGLFTKVISGQLGSQEPLVLDEVFWSRSDKGVLRGMHVQIPPKAGRKIVFLTSGRVRDFIVDLRVGSPWFGRLWETQLAEDSGALLIPAGCAHGFEAVTDGVTMVYLQEGTYDSATDTGVRWDSVGIIPVADEPVVSERDQGLVPLSEFDSPLVWVDYD